LLPSLFGEGIVLKGCGDTIKDGLRDASHGEVDAGAIKRAKRSCEGW
jgi:hypothetical protein